MNKGREKPHAPGAELTRGSHPCQAARGEAVPSVSGPVEPARSGWVRRPRQPVSRHPIPPADPARLSSRAGQSRLATRRLLRQQARPGAGCRYHRGRYPEPDTNDPPSLGLSCGVVITRLAATAYPRLSNSDEGWIVFSAGPGIALQAYISDSLSPKASFLLVPVTALATKVITTIDSRTRQIGRVKNRVKSPRNMVID